MKKQLLFIFLLLFIENLFAQESKLTIHPSKPEAGDSIKIIYTGNLAKPGTEMQCIYNYMGDNKHNILFINSFFEESKIIGRLRLPDSVLYFTVKIINKEEFDNNNGKTYGFNIYENGKPKKGTFFTQGASEFYNDYYFNAKVDTLKAIKLMEKEYQLYPDLKESTLPIYLNRLKLDKSRKETAVRLATEYYNEILRTGKNDRFTEQIAEIITGTNLVKRDSLIDTVAKKYPKGKAALRKQYKDFYFTVLYSPESAATKYHSIINNFSKIDPVIQTQLDEYLLMTYEILLDYDNFDKQVSKIENPIFLAGEYNEIARNMAENNIDLKKAKEYSEKSLLEIEKLIELKKLPESIKIEFATSKAKYLDTYTYILDKLRDTHESADTFTK